MSDRRYLKTFFKEKGLSYQMYEVLDEDGTPNFIDSDTVIDLIVKAPYEEQHVIAEGIRRIDFRNGDLHQYLRFLASAFVRTQRATAERMQ